MSTIRRWYIYVICAFSMLLAVSALADFAGSRAVHGLEGLNSTDSALQLAVIVVGLAVYVPHWLWAERLVRREAGEREALLRAVYLYGVMFPLFMATVGYASGLLHPLLAQAINDDRWYGGRDTLGEIVLQNVLGLLIMGLVWAYHLRIALRDTLTVRQASVRRVYVLVFTTFGMLVGGFSLYGLLLRFLYAVRRVPNTGGQVFLEEPLSALLTNFLLFGALAFGFGGWAQRLFASGQVCERESVVRKLYLYAAVFVGAQIVVFNAAPLLAGLLRKALELPAMGEWPDPVSSISVGLGVWGAHTLLLRSDARVASDIPRQAEIRRLYWYLMAAVGLAAVVVGTAGWATLMIRLVSGASGMTNDMKELLAWSTAALACGLPVWMFPWRVARKEALASGAQGEAARASLSRKAYLYLYLLVAVLVVLGCAIYVAYRVITFALGVAVVDEGIADLAQAVAYGAIAGLLWGYHWQCLRSDHHLGEQARHARLSGMRVAVLDTGDGHLGRALLNALHSQLPEVQVQAIGLTPEAHAAMQASEDLPSALQKALEADLLFAPWTLAGPGDGVSLDVAAMLSNSHAHKYLLPARTAQWDMLAVETEVIGSAVRQVLEEVKRAER